jgi:MFS family permease
MRWFALFILSGLTFATYWFQDFMGGIKELLTSEYGFNSEQYGRIISFTTITNMVGMIIVGGIILDKWGVRLAGLLFGGMSALGAVLVYFGSADVFGSDVEVKMWTMSLGRMIFGSGLEVVCVVATRTIVKWFKGYELALAMAINIGFGRLGSAMGIAVSPDIAALGNVSTSIGFAASLLGIALIMFVIYLFFDLRLDRQTAVTAQESDEEKFRISDLLKLLKNQTFIYITLLCVVFYAAVFPFIQYASDLLVNKFGFSSQLPDDAAVVIGGSAALGNALVFVGLFIFAICFSTIPPRLKTRAIQLVGRFIILILFAGYIYILKDILAVWLTNGPKTSSLIPLGTIIFTPVFGSFVDKHGKAASLMILGSVLLICSHLALSVFNNVILGYFGLLSLGVAFSLVPAAMWPSVAKIVPENRLGTAYATMFTVQNWGLGAFYWGIGAVLELVNKDNLDEIKDGNAAYDYTIPILILVICGIVSVFLSYKLMAANKKYDYGL